MALKNKKNFTGRTCGLPKVDGHSPLYRIQSCPRGSLFLDPTWRNIDPTSPRESLTRPAIADKKSDPTPHVYLLCFMSSTFKLPTAGRGNNIRYLQLFHDFDGNREEYFSSGFVMFSESEKITTSSGLIFQVSRQQKFCKCQMLVKCIQGLI